MEVLACVQEGAWLQMVLWEVAASCSSEHQGVVCASEVETFVSAVEEGWVWEEECLSLSVEPLEVAVEWAELQYWSWVWMQLLVLDLVAVEEL